MENDREWIPEEAWDILDKAICAICPNPIRDAPFSMLKDRDVIADLLKRGGDGTIITGPHGPFMMIHVRCYNNARLVLGMQPADGETP